MGGVPPERSSTPPSTPPTSRILDHFGHVYFGSSEPTSQGTPNRAGKCAARRRLPTVKRVERVNRAGADHRVGAGSTGRTEGLGPKGGPVSETTATAPEELAEELRSVDARLVTAPASKAIEWAVERFGKDLVLAASVPGRRPHRPGRQGRPDDRGRLLGHRGPLPRDPRLRRAGPRPLRPEPDRHPPWCPTPTSGRAARPSAASSARWRRCAGRWPARRPG